MNMGIVFQMMDDLIDIFGDPVVAKKSLRNNLSEGTVTLPMIHACELYADTPPLRRLARGEQLDARSQAQLYRKFASRKVFSRSMETVKSYSGKAEACLKQMPLNIYSTGLADLFDYIKDCSWGGLTSQGKDKEVNSRG
jgi:heptaprenyl diphosphate synthase